MRYGLDVGGALCAFADYLCELFRNMDALQREICLTFWEFVIDTERATQIQNTNQLKPSNSVHFNALGTCNAFFRTAFMALAAFIVFMGRYNRGTSKYSHQAYFHEDRCVQVETPV